MVAARAQEPLRLIGARGRMSYGALHDSNAACIRGLQASDFLQSKNISIEWRWARGEYDRLHPATFIIGEPGTGHEAG